MKSYKMFPEAPELEPQHQTVLCLTQDRRIWRNKTVFHGFKKDVSLDINEFGSSILKHCNLIISLSVRAVE